MQMSLMLCDISGHKHICSWNSLAACWSIPWQYHEPSACSSA